MMDTANRDERNGGRWDLYQWFSSVLAQEQDQAAWDLHTSEDFVNTLEARADEHGIGDAAKPLATYLREQQEGGRREDLMTLAVDYAQLFIGPGPGQAPPFESVYTSEEGRLYADAYANLIEMLHEEGIAVADDFSAPADHAAVELAVMAHLIERDADGDDSSSAIGETQADFLTTHVLNWFPRWCDDVAKHAQTDFYRGVGRLLAAFIARERETLGDRTPAPSV